MVEHNTPTFISWGVNFEFREKNAWRDILLQISCRQLERYRFHTLSNGTN